MMPGRTCVFYHNIPVIGGGLRCRRFRQALKQGPVWESKEHNQDMRQVTSPPEGLPSLAGRAQPISLHEVSGWEAFWQRMLFRVLLPVETLVRYGIDPVRLVDGTGVPVVRVIPGENGHNVRLEVSHTLSARDPLLELELADTQFNQVEVLWVAFQNPFSSRFDVDVMPDGQPTMRGSVRRNLPAEEGALAAGLAPGQTRRGLGAFRKFAWRMETFMACLNQAEYIAQPLFYHTAVLFERIGFSYIQGQSLMERITQGFAPGGDLRRRLDGSSPFRQPELADTIRGRSWAIHDGVLEDQSWDRVRMIKRLGADAEVDSAAGIPW